MIHVVVKWFIVLLLLIHIEIFEGAGVLKIGELESEVLCTDSTALLMTIEGEALKLFE
jgi:hypothetical protein